MTRVHVETDQHVLQDNLGHRYTQWLLPRSTREGIPLCGMLNLGLVGSFDQVALEPFPLSIDKGARRAKTGHSSQVPKRTDRRKFRF
jgi:hypothetical protein